MWFLYFNLFFRVIFFLHCLGNVIIISKIKQDVLSDKYTLVRSGDSKTASVYEDSCGHFFTNISLF